MSEEYNDEKHTAYVWVVAWFAVFSFDQIYIKHKVGSISSTVLISYIAVQHSCSAYLVRYGKNDNLGTCVLHKYYCLCAFGFCFRTYPETYPKIVTNHDTI